MGQARADHAAERAEEDLVRPVGVARPAMRLDFQRRIIGIDELARAAAAPGIVGARDAAIGAQAAFDRRADGNRLNRAGGIVRLGDYDLVLKRMGTSLASAAAEAMVG
jgi:hypothetical protein